MGYKYILLRKKFINYNNKRMSDCLEEDDM